MSSTDAADYVVLALMGILALLAFGFSLFVLQRAAIGFGVLLLLLVLYFFLRLVRGVERIATALEEAE